MLPGPEYIYKCPECSSLLKQCSIMSGNTFGSKLYSDGFMDAPMLPRFAGISKCRDCNTFFKVEDLTSIGEYYLGEKVPQQWSGAKEITFLDIDENFEALASPDFDTAEHEIYLRQMIWHEYNHRIRKRRKIFQDKADELHWIENMKALIGLMDPGDPQQKFLIAEMYRNLGDFDRCREFLKGFEDTDLESFSDQILAECEKANRWVIELK